MRNFWVLLMVGLSFLGLSGCKAPGCLVQDKLVESGTSAIVKTLECTGTAAIQADLTKVVGVFGLCKGNELPTGPLADTFCPVVADAVVEFVTTHGIPAEWKCSSASAKDSLKNILTTTCKRLPLSEK